MIGYIKDRKTFQTLDMLLDITQYDLVLGAVSNNVSTALVLGELKNLENQFFIYENKLWLIKSLAPEDGLTTITLNDISYIFARDLVWDENATFSSIEECIADTIDSEYINLSDPEYDTPYITVSYSTATGFIKPDIEGGLWNLKGYIAKVRRMKNVFLDYSISGDTLNITIEQRTPAVHKIDFATDVAQMEQETYQKTSIAKITVNGTTDYYLYEDGTYGTDPNLKARAEGDWQQLQVRETENETEKVEDLFSKNAESRIIEFYTDLPVNFYDTVILRNEGRVTSGTLSTVSISSEDNRKYCKTGDLIDTVPEAISVLSERIEKVTKTVANFDPNSGGGGGDEPNPPILLWSNPNPTSSFAPQTVTLSQSASDFDLFYVITRYKGNYNGWHVNLARADGNSYTLTSYRNAVDTGYVYNWREVSISGSSATFTRALYWGSGGGSPDNTACIPFYIYGISIKGPKGDKGDRGEAGGGFGDLLWTNSSPTTSFSAQTVNVNLSGYRFVAIECMATKDYQNHMGFQIFPVGATNGRYQANVTNVSAQRNIDSITTSSVVFGAGYRYATYSQSPTTDNSVLIPHKIYGVT